MNGSVGASVAALARVVHPRLRRRGVASDQSLAVICVASTLGVVVPPSLILILLGDAMLRAHTEAVNATHRLDRIINTQDVFRGALPPAALFLLLAFLLVLWLGRRAPQAEAPAEPRLGWRGRSHRARRRRRDSLPPRRGGVGRDLRRRGCRRPARSCSFSVALPAAISIATRCARCCGRRWR